MKNNKSTILLLLSSAALLLILITSVFILFGNQKDPKIITETVTVPETKTEYIYIEIPKETVDIYAPTLKQETEVEEKYFIREHDGRIGVFDENEILIEMIDVYIKTLPETDKKLLKEGFTVIGEKALGAIREDYLE